ncbi:histidine--tRNA ligase [Myxococcota bacterium]|nr:histidine--tRNA ligase [Myxococcota bacterium]
MSQKLQAPRGTRDFYPDEMRLRRWLFDHFEEVARRYGFEQIDAPIVEHEELFTRKAGEEIVEQLYHFELHDRRLALRPEMTPSLARMVLARSGSLRMPLRWFSLPQCWRYERMTRGRKREHYQWNMDIWGEPDVTAEAELIAAACDLLDRVAIPRGDVKIRINNRKLLEQTLAQSVLRERPERFAPLCVVIDKIDKIGPDAVLELLTDPGGEVALPPEDGRFVVDWLGLRDLGDALSSGPAHSSGGAELSRLFELLDAYGIADRVVFDASVVRGLAYYTGVVFEAFDTAGELRAICGGGRYDNLLETLGGRHTPAVGFGLGDVVIGELLADRNLLPDCTRELDALVFPFGETERRAAVGVATALRKQGLAVDLVLNEARLKRVLSDADHNGARRVYLLGPDELARGEVLVRDLQSGEQHTEPLAEPDGEPPHN